MTRISRLGPAVLCATVAVLAAIASALGVFARGDGATMIATTVRGGTFEVALNGVYANNAQRIVAEGVGWDFFTLIVAAPALLIAAYFVWRGSFNARLVAAGLLGYFLYMYLEYAVTWAFGPLFLLFVVIYGTSIVGLAWMAATIAEEGVNDRFTDRFPRRAWAALSVGMSVLLTVLWVGRIWQALSGDADAVLFGETTMTVQALDLGLVVPVSVMIAWLAWRRTSIGYVLAASFAITYAAMSAAIGSMLISAGIYTGTYELPPLVIFGLATVASIAVAIRMYRSRVPMTKAAKELRPTTSDQQALLSGA